MKKKPTINKNTPNPITPPNNLNNKEGSLPKKPSRWQDTYFCMRSWRERPASDDFLEEMGKDFYEWCYNLAFNEKDLKPYSLTRWRLEKGIPEGTLKHWRDRNKKLDRYISEGVSLLGIIREQGVFNKQLSERAVMYTLPHYSSEWRSMDTYHDERKKESLSKLSGFIGAVIEEVDLNDKDREAE